jgi:hypothetical protein
MLIGGEAFGGSVLWGLLGVRVCPDFPADLNAKAAVPESGNGGGGVFGKGDEGGWGIQLQVADLHRGHGLHVAVFVCDFADGDDFVNRGHGMGSGCGCVLPSVATGEEYIRGCACQRIIWNFF